jgi:hypothetical protein
MARGGHEAHRVVDGGFAAHNSCIRHRRPQHPPTATNDDSDVDEEADADDIDDDGTLSESVLGKHGA